MKLAEFGNDATLHAMHLSEIEDEAGRIFDTLTALRVYSRQEDVDATEETLAELTISFEHLLHHLREVLPALQKQLDIEP